MPRKPTPRQTAPDYIVSAREVAAFLHTDVKKVKSGIKNGTMPIGTVLQQDGSTRERIVILRDRWEAWKDAQDLKRG